MTSAAATAALPALDPDRPVLVIGNGPVGQTTALLLAAWNVPVVLLDARPERDPIGSKAICQQRDVLDVWAHVGAGEQIAQEGLTWIQARTMYRDHELFCQGFVDKGHSPFPPFVNISQTRTEQVLDEQIARSPLIDVRWGHRVVGLAEDADAVTLRCAVGTADAQAPDEFLEVRGSYAVACPGGRGDMVRNMLGVTFDGKTFTDQFLICDIRTHMPGWEQERRFYFDPEWNPGRQVLIHPCPDSTFRIDWQVPPEYDLGTEEASGALDRRIRKVIGDQDYEIVWKSQYRFHARQVDRMRVGRVLIAGDAAHLVAPFGARGLNSGVLDAENAAWKLAFVLHGWSGDALLDTYHDERHAAAKENLDVTSATMSFLVPQSEQEWTHRREILEAAGADPQARAQVDSGRLAEPYWYIDSPLTTPHPTRVFPGRPPKGEPPEVVPGVLVPDVPVRVDGERTRLREVARRGVTLLAGAGVDVPALAAATDRGTLPLRIHAAADLDVDGQLASSVGVGPGEVWVLRPDAHIAAILGDAADVPAALARVVGEEQSAQQR